MMILLTKSDRRTQDSRWETILQAKVMGETRKREGNRVITVIQSIPHEKSKAHKGYRGSDSGCTIKKGIYIL